MNNKILKISAIFIFLLILFFPLISFCAKTPPTSPSSAAPPSSASPTRRPQLSKEQKEEINNIITFFNEKLQHRFTPEVLNVDVKPDTPKTGEPITIEAKIGYLIEKPEDTVKEAFVHYSTDDGKKWKKAKMKNTGGNKWLVNIPPVRGVKKILYNFWIKDSYGNIYAELPCKVTTWPPFEDECMVDIAGDLPPTDDEEALIGGDFDYWEMRAGMDDNFFYLHQSVENEIFKGTMNPPKISIYAALILDTSLLKEISDIGIFMQSDNKKDKKEKGEKVKDEKAKDEKAEKEWKEKAEKVKFITYAPMAPAFDNKFDACTVNYSFGGKGKMDPESIKCKKDGPDLFFKIKKEVIGKKLSEKMVLVGGLDGYIEDMKMPIPEIKEFTSFTTLVNVKREIILK